MVKVTGLHAHEELFERAGHTDQNEPQLRFRDGRPADHCSLHCEGFSSGSQKAPIFEEKVGCVVGFWLVHLCVGGDTSRACRYRSPVV